jgi:hypothetical protein
MTRATNTKRVLKDLTPKGNAVSREFEGQPLADTFTTTSALKKVGGNNREPIVVYTGEYKGQPQVHVRKVWTNNNDEWAPGKGITLAPGDLPAVIAALKELAD